MKILYQLQKMNYFRLIIFFTLLFSSSLFVSCDQNKKNSKDEEVSLPTIDSNYINRHQDTVNFNNKAKELANLEEIKYTKVLVSGEYSVEKLKEMTEPVGLDSSKRKILTTLNRKEFRFIRNGDSLVVPSKLLNNQQLYSVFPQTYPGAMHIKKIIMVSNAMQEYACYENGILVRSSAVNSGKEKTQTYPGRYALNWKAWKKTSSLDSSWILPFTWNFHRQAGNAFHQFEMPGRPVSHSCCRQFLDDAKWLFKWGRGSKYDSLKRDIPMSGTPVIIIDVFNYARKKYGPWIDLKSNKDGILKLPLNPMAVEEAIIPLGQIPKEARGSLRNYKRYLYGEDTLRARGVIREGVELIYTVNFNEKRRLDKVKKEKEEKRKLEKELLEAPKEN